MMILLSMASSCFRLWAFNLSCTVGSRRRCRVDLASLAHAASVLVAFLMVVLVLILVRLVYNLVCWRLVVFYSLD